MVGHFDCKDLFLNLCPRLHQLVEFEFLHLALYNSASNTMRQNVLETPIRDVPYTLPRELPIEQSLAALVWQSQRPLTWTDISQETRFPQIVDSLRRNGVVSYCLLPLTTPQRQLGAIGFGSTSRSAYQNEDVHFLEKVAAVVAAAVGNVLHYESARAYEQDLKHERDRLQLLLEITTAVARNLELRDLLPAISESLRRVLHHEFASLVLLEPSGEMVRVHGLDFPKSIGLIHEDLVFAFQGSVAEKVLQAKKPLIFREFEAEGVRKEIADLLAREHLKSLCSAPLLNRNRPLGVLNVASTRPNAFSKEDMELLLLIANQISVAIDNSLTFEQVQKLKDRLAEEKLYLEDEIRNEYNFGQIIGESKALKDILKLVETVAPTDASVLIQGETGTGKELIARAIHRLSKRQDRTFVKLNCAAIPTGLLESELFGHEKGAFTGAISQKVGRIELAQNGTLFLDEIGDLPLEIQPKLLRVLQEKEFERLGGTRTIHVDLRLIAATNRNLEQMVADRQFRNDLYYRLRVVPLSVPPLRERREDIATLVRYFIQKHARHMGKHFRAISPHSMESLMAWHWPGNIRELENLVERAVILSPSPMLNIPLDELAPSSQSGAPDPTLTSVEREHILHVLRETHGVISGPNGAASRLGMKRTTLQARMKKLGISRAET
ncbi:MAG: sigma 54-interacting transcriptional regulator [Terriglobia bacterium]|nr:sigma 54-interacting transcriptional regulator [Terriglobia bacterium]